MKEQVGKLVAFISSLVRGNAVEPEVGVEEEEVVEEEGELVLNPEDTQMVASLTERLVRSIRVEQSVLSLLGTILQIFKTAGHLGQGPEKVDLTRIFRPDVVALITEYWSENEEVMALIEEHCVIKPPTIREGVGEETRCATCVLQ